MGTAVKEDQDKWLHEMMEDLIGGQFEEQPTRRLFRKLRDINGNRAKPTSTILNENGQPIKTKEEKLAQWKMYFEEVWNVQSMVAEKLIASV